MTDFATPNLPALSFDATEAFYAKLGFETLYKADAWMILKRDNIMLEFFPYADLSPRKSMFSCCIRLDDLDGFVETCVAAEIPVGSDQGRPRIVPPSDESSGIRVAFLVDENGSLIRLIAN